MKVAQIRSFFPGDVKISGAEADPFVSIQRSVHQARFAKRFGDLPL